MIRASGTDSVAGYQVQGMRAGLSTALQAEQQRQGHVRVGDDAGLTAQYAQWEESGSRRRALNASGPPQLLSYAAPQARWYLLPRTIRAVDMKRRRTQLATACTVLGQGQLNACGISEATDDVVAEKSVCVVLLRRQRPGDTPGMTELPCARYRGMRLGKYHDFTPKRSFLHGCLGFKTKAVKNHSGNTMDIAKIWTH
ncbi:hypothetical protein K438DRAFT_1786566 [Mycena galopus ATCC 62051]|nr:hypothetical protein K438DRAFT_1786566 [Mycena galopus ATCC 62051]